MKKCMFAVVAVLALGSAVQAGEPALAKLGLGGLEVISEKEGMEVRGLSADTFSSGSTSVRGMLAVDTSNYVSFETLLFGRSADSTSGADATLSDGASAQVLHPVLFGDQTLSQDVAGGTYTGTIGGNVIGAGTLSQGHFTTPLSLFTAFGS